MFYPVRDIFLPRYLLARFFSSKSVCRIFFLKSLITRSKGKWSSLKSPQHLLSTPSLWESSKTGTVCQTISSMMKLMLTNVKKAWKGGWKFIDTVDHILIVYIFTSYSAVRWRQPKFLRSIGVSNFLFFFFFGNYLFASLYNSQFSLAMGLCSFALRARSPKLHYDTRPNWTIGSSVTN